MPGRLQPARRSPARERLILIDADVLGRERTGDETYVTNLLRTLPAVAPDLRFAAVTRRPELVPEGVEPIALPARLQEARMAVALPRLLRRLRPELAHFQHALPLGAGGGRTVVTIHDLSFEQAETAMGLLDRLTFRIVVPRAARRADHVLAVSERTRRDLLARYGIPATKVTVTPNGVDPAFTPAPGRDVPARAPGAGAPGGAAGIEAARPAGASGPGGGERAEAGGAVSASGAHGGYLLFVGAIQARKQPLTALAAADAAGLPLVVAGPEKDAGLARALREGGAELRGYVSKEELAGLYRSAAALLLPSRFEGFGLPLLEAMACGTPVVAAAEPALREVGGEAAVYAEEGDFAAATRRALEQRERLSAAGIERAKRFSWEETARRTAEVYRRLLE